MRLGLGSLLLGMRGGGAPAPVLVSASYTQFDTSGLGAPITLTGESLSGCTAVTVDGVGVAPTSVSDTEVTFIAPAHIASASVDVTVTTPGGTSAPIVCSYWGPEAANVTLLHDWDPAVAASLTLVGSKVSVMLDLVGGGHQRQSTDSARPTFVASDPDFGGAPTLLHNRQYFVADTSYSLAKPCSILFVGKATDGYVSFFAAKSGSNNGMLYVTGGAVKFYGTNLGASISYSTGTRAALLLEDDGTNNRIYRNNIASGAGSSGSVWTSNLSNIQIGNEQIGTPRFKGTFVRQMVFDGVLDAPSKSKLAVYLNNARGYGIGVTA